MDFKEFHLVGHSMGGAIAMIVANVLPNRVKKLVLVCPLFAGFNKNVFKCMTLFPSISSKHPDKLLKMLYLDYRKNYKTTPESRREIQPKDNFEIHKNYSILLLNIIFNVKAIKRLRFSQNNLLLPTLLMVSVHDNIIAHTGAIKNIATKDNVQVYKFFKSGHIPFIEEDELFAQTLLSYLEGTYVPQKESESEDESE